MEFWLRIRRPLVRLPHLPEGSESAVSWAVLTAFLIWLASFIGL